MRPLISCIALFVSLIAVMIPKQAARACGFWVFPGEYRFWLLQPDLTNQYDLTPFYFASNYLYKGDMWAARETYFDQNIEEWFIETKGKVRRDQIDSLLYYTDPQYFADNPKQLAKENSFMRFLMQPSQKELYRYMALSKKVEQIAANPDPWGDNPGPNKYVRPVIEEALRLRNETRSDFLKLRTAFQLTRLYRYDQPEMVKPVYEKWIEPVKTKSWIKSAALYQRAHTAKRLEFDYFLSKVFDRGDYNRTPCLVFFNSNKLDSILHFAKNQHERNVLYAMRAFNYTGRSLDFIKNIYQTEPEYKELPFLLLREINKVEDWLLTNKVTDFGHPAVYGEGYWDGYSYMEHASTNYANDVAYAKALYRLLLKMISNEKTKQKALLHLYSAHICLLLNDASCSQNHLEAAAALQPAERNVKTQLRINTYLLKLEKGFDADTEHEFMSLINTSAAAIGVYDPEIMKNQLILYTARKLIKKGYKAKGLMLLSRTNRALGELPISDYKRVYQEIEEHAAPADYDEMIRILAKKNKTGFERFVSKIPFESPYQDTENDAQYKWGRNKLLDCKASWYLRQRMPKEALAVLKQIPDSFWKAYPYSDHITGNAFFLNVYKSYAATPEDKRTMNKKEIVKEMLQLEELAKTNSAKAAECYFQLANAWYNMSYYGKHWLMVKQWWSSKELPDYPKEKGTSSPFFEDYYQCRTAKAYYTKALTASKDKKLKALSYYMIQQCESKKRFYNDVLTKEYADWRDFTLQLKPKKELKKNGIDADYYEQIVNECETYQSFIKQYNRKL
ncbi:MAG: hypothetical protein WCF67_03570 [Chitinophagaceae bacterium]